MEVTPHLRSFQRIAVMIRKRLADDADPTTSVGGSSVASRGSELPSSASGAMMKHHDCTLFEPGFQRQRRDRYRPGATPRINVPHKS